LMLSKVTDSCSSEVADLPAKQSCFRRPLPSRQNTEALNKYFIFNLLSVA
jgi:hypothetical protein